MTSHDPVTTLLHTSVPDYTDPADPSSLNAPTHSQKFPEMPPLALLLCVPGGCLACGHSVLGRWGNRSPLRLLHP